MIKMYDGVLLTWVLSGEMVYSRVEGFSDRKAEIEEWVNCVTFAEWSKWQKQLGWAEHCIKKKKE